MTQKCSFRIFGGNTVAVIRYAHISHTAAFISTVIQRRRRSSFHWFLDHGSRPLDDLTSCDQVCDVRIKLQYFDKITIPLDADSETFALDILYRQTLTLMGSRQDDLIPDGTLNIRHVDERMHHTYFPKTLARCEPILTCITLLRRRRINEAALADVLVYANHGNTRPTARRFLSVFMTWPCSPPIR